MLQELRVFRHSLIEEIDSNLVKEFERAANGFPRHLSHSYRKFRGLLYLN